MKKISSKSLLLSILLFLACQCLLAQEENNLCIHSAPFCTEDNPYGISFPAGTTSTNAQEFPGGSTGCLYSTPAPAWYVMQIDAPGDLLIHMTHSGGRDIDFACWGPFTGYANQNELVQAVCLTQLTGSSQGSHCPTNGYHDPNNPGTWGGYPSGNLVDCSYSTASTEWCFIPNAQHGEWYVFLICNYSRAAGTISFDVYGQGAPGSQMATTNCDILANVSNNGPLCEGEALQLTCSVSSSSGYQWTNPNGVMFSTQQNPIISPVTVNDAGQYTVFYRVARTGAETVTGSATVEIAKAELILTLTLADRSAPNVSRNSWNYGKRACRF